jgi:hypothetical protein
MIWKKIKRYLPLIGIAIFVYLLIKLDIVEIIKQIKNIKLSYFIIAIVLVFIYLLFATAKWFIIARKQGMKVHFGEAFKINLITDFYGFVTPARLGSAMRADYLKKYSGNVGKGFSNFVIDKILDLSSLFIMAIGLGFVFRKSIGITSISSIFILLALFLTMILISLIFYKKESSKFFLRIIYRKFIPKSMKNKARQMFNSFYKDMPKLSFLILVFLVNLMTWIINYFITYLVGLSLGINVGFIYYLAIFPIATLIAQIPITISGLGTREITLIGLFGLFGVEAVKVFSMAIISLIIVTILPAVFAIYIMLKEKSK